MTIRLGSIEATIMFEVEEQLHNAAFREFTCLSATEEPGAVGFDFGVWCAKKARFAPR